MDEFHKDLNNRFKVIRESFLITDDNFKEAFGEIDTLKEQMKKKDKEVEKLNKKVQVTRRVQGIITLVTTGISLTTLFLMHNLSRK